MDRSKHPEFHSDHPDSLKNDLQSAPIVNPGSGEGVR
jgi:hypothetical protein